MLYGYFVICRLALLLDQRTFINRQKNCIFLTLIFYPILFIFPNLLNVAVSMQLGQGECQSWIFIWREHHSSNMNHVGIDRIEYFRCRGYAKVFHFTFLGIQPSSKHKIKIFILPSHPREVDVYNQYYQLLLSSF